MNVILAVSATVLVLVVVLAVVACWLAHEHSLLRITDVEGPSH